MRTLAVVAGTLTVVLGASLAGAQQHPPQPGRAGTMMAHHESMMMMDSLNRRLDSLVTRMNCARGNQKVTAMAAVINELVAQRKAMQGHMRQMMGHGEMMGQGQGMGPGERMHQGETRSMMNDSASPAARLPAAGIDSAKVDTAGHAAHHPSQ